jgi:hypothetical protein
MNVKNLIEILKKYPEDNLILLEGYEGGLSEIGVIQESTVKLNQNKEDYYGPHEKSENDEPSDINAIIFYRAPNIQ